MATHQAERVGGADRQAMGVPTSGPRVSTGSCVRVSGGAGSSTLTVRRPGRPDIDLVLPAAPDPAMSRRLTGGFRRVSWVSIDVSGGGTTCQVAGCSRQPRRIRVPLAAALALADAAVPTVVRLQDQRA